MRDTYLHNKDCSEMHSGSSNQMTPSCKCLLQHGEEMELQNCVLVYFFIAWLVKYQFYYF